MKFGVYAMWEFVLNEKSILQSLWLNKLNSQEMGSTIHEKIMFLFIINVAIVSTTVLRCGYSINLQRKH